MELCEIPLQPSIYMLGEKTLTTQGYIGSTDLLSVKPGVS